MLAGISTLCFFASYTVTLVLEVSRLFFRAPIRLAVMIFFALAGLFAHSVYLWLRAQEQLTSGAPLSSWYDWCLMAAWILAAAYLGLALRRPKNAIGLFILPLVLGLIGIALLVRDIGAFPREEALDHWRMIHGVSLLIGTVGVTLGFAAGVMYLVQSYRLKHKLPPRPGLALPSLEWLQRFNRESLFVSTLFLAVGLISGIVMNLANESSRSSVPWTDLGVVFSGILFVWLLAATVFETVYKPARQGRKIVYLTLASFVFLGLALGFVLFGEHAGSTNHTGWRPKRGEVMASRLDLVDGKPNGSVR